jgi:hypothetical protein
MLGFKRFEGGGRDDPRQDLPDRMALPAPLKKRLIHPIYKGLL